MKMIPRIGALALCCLLLSVTVVAAADVMTATAAYYAAQNVEMDAADDYDNAKYERDYEKAYTKSLDDRMDVVWVLIPQADRLAINQILSSADNCRVTAFTKMDFGNDSWNTAYGYMSDGDYWFNLEDYETAVDKYDQARFHYGYAESYYEQATMSWQSTLMYLGEAEAIVAQYE